MDGQENGRSPGGDPSGILRWLQDEGALFQSTPQFMEAFGARLGEAGIDVWRMTTGVFILHPQIDAASSLWERGKPPTERRFRLDETGVARVANSPMAEVYRGGSVRMRLDGSPVPGEYPIFAELRAEGATDYLALPLRFSDRSWAGITLATRRPGGFTEAEVGLMRALAPVLALLLEMQTLRRTTSTLLKTYVGRRAGKRVLSGAIKRGMHQPIQAVIWLSDLRDFTRNSQLLGGAALTAMLDDYFGAITEAVERNDGEVLKFIGDAMLAIFPLTGHDPADVAGRALRAAGEAEAAIAGINAKRVAASLPPIEHGLALHAGEVFYGNIGGHNRLDFTVIGPAVNVAARIEALCRTLDRTLLMSGAFTAIAGCAAEPLGTHRLKGIAGDVAVFGLAREPAGTISRGVRRRACGRRRGTT